MRSTRVVSHPVFGEGEVVDARWRGTEILVRFRTGLRLWLPTRKVQMLTNIDEELLGRAEARFSAIDRVQACRMVEAFRMGVVPHRDVESFTFGREREVTLIESAMAGLAAGQGDVFLVEGEYGTGKTHLLEYIHHRALREGMLTTLCSLDPQEVSPHRPKRVYREIVHNLRYIADGSVQGFRDLMRRAIDFELDMTDHVFLGPVLDRLRRLDPGNVEQEVFWQWIEGESTKEYATDARGRHRVRGAQKIPALYDFSTAADFYCNILSGLSRVGRATGLMGLVLLIDEAETVTRLWDIIYLTKSVNFMEGLVRMAQADPELRSISRRMIHNRVRPVPYVYGNPTVLLALATTPSPYDYAYLKLANRVERRLELKPLEDKALVDAFATLLMIYRRAYPGFDPEETLQKQLFRAAVRRSVEGVRVFIKFCTEGLDIARSGRGQTVEALTLS